MRTRQVRRLFGGGYEIVVVVDSRPKQFKVDNRV